MKCTIVITLGRNINNESMGTNQWNEFKDDVDAMLLDSDACILQRPLLTTFFNADQQGVWNGEVEPACTFVAIVSSLDLGEIKKQLASIAKYYEQQCVGFIVQEGDNNVINAE